MADTDSSDQAVLFVDDEPFFAARYIEELEKCFRVHFLNRAVEVLPFLEENPNVSAVILDIMMPTPEGVDAEVTQEGLDTGLWLLDRMRLLGTWPFPVMVLTNRNPQVIRKELGERSVPKSFVKVRQKLDTRASALPALVTGLMEEAKAW